MSFFFFLALPLLLSSPPPLNSYPYDTSYRIDCGGQTNFTNRFNETWLSDRFFTGGSTSPVAETHLFQQQQEQTLRFFPISFGKKNCYIVNVPTGRYYIRTFTVYDNYDGKLHSPSFDVSVEGTLVFSWRSPWGDDVSRTGAYSDLFAFVKDGEADICFYSIATDPPVIGSLEVVQIDPLSYDSSTTGNNLILINYGRLTCGSDLLGAGFTNDTDLFGRAWQSDAEFRTGNLNSVKVIQTRRNVLGTNQRPNYFPMHLYQTAVTVVGGGALEYELSVDAKLDYLVWFHFAEIDTSVTAAGQRVFDVFINQRNVSRIDIFKHVGSFAAFNWHYIVKNLNTTYLRVKLVPVVGSPLISGLENYAMVPRDLATVPEQVTAMRALKESLKVPDRMGWNGDPCAPSNWDAWEGVTCHPNKDKSALVVSQMNLSSNSLGGTIPSQLGQKSLTRLDLSNNLLSGPIPDGLSASSLQLVLLNDNQLEGQVPEELYSIGVHGGAIDLSHNKGLCGVPSLPSCPLFWGKGGLSTAGKIAIGLSCLAVLGILILVIYVCCIRRGSNDYDFALPQDLISLSAKRNRYQRQKSLMLLEMETQNANGFPSSNSR
ncbi:PREDICTED: probable LRR receptor-like serine/threonine-protein kinase At1g51860 isoform X2 [Nelumbo nucifera]|uniref:Probable LRR receptor-like serine/threonine-protein kinase At1g51860 isoform X2 n=1 Tax=Nelumbo nucifera TaxID=4432 RepID=A0A1U8Q888_NELNU|nr:PREDICTED: probable LRR receptor-like serine/threonine-protein kinase At1g51860 isoform X2 [Nelumbo nucifera]